MASGRAVLDRIEADLKAQLRLAWWRLAMSLLTLALVIVCGVNAYLAYAEGKTEKALLWVCLGALLGQDRRLYDIERKLEAQK